MINAKLIYGKFLHITGKLFGLNFAKKFDTRLRFHKKLNLKTPQSLSEKISYIELHAQSPLAPQCTDKYAVRDYVASKGYAHTLVPVLGGAWERIDQIDFDNLPDEFVLKATHGCKMNYIVKNKNDMDIEECRTEMKRWLNTTYGGYSVEPHYEKIPHRIYAEKYLGDMSGLIDYKFYCLNGEPMFVTPLFDRKANGDAPMQVKIDLFDMDWNFIPEVISCGTETAGEGKTPKPACFDQMIELARALSSDFDFVRVDLYEYEGKVLFGELTFTPACCVIPFISDKFLLEMGKKLTVSNLNKK